MRQGNRFATLIPLPAMLKRSLRSANNLPVTAKMMALIYYGAALMVSRALNIWLTFWALPPELILHARKILAVRLSGFYFQKPFAHRRLKPALLFWGP